MDTAFIFDGEKIIVANAMINDDDDVESVFLSEDSSGDAFVICTVRNRHYGPEILKWSVQHRWRNVDNAASELINVNSEGDAERFLIDFKNLVRELVGVTDDISDDDVFGFVHSPSYIVNKIDEVPKP